MPKSNCGIVFLLHAPHKTYKCCSGGTPQRYLQVVSCQMLALAAN